MMVAMTLLGKLSLMMVAITLVMAMMVVIALMMAIMSDDDHSGNDFGYGNGYGNGGHSDDECNYSYVYWFSIL